MSDKPANIRDDKLWRRAEALHRRGCPDDEPLATRSLNHQHVHLTEAQRERARAVTP
jgi:hypothetical protein